jgi:hypothetical protein
VFPPAMADRVPVSHLSPVGELSWSRWTCESTPLRTQTKVSVSQRQRRSIAGKHQPGRDVGALCVYNLCILACLEVVAEKRDFPILDANFHAEGQNLGRRNLLMRKDARLVPDAGKVPQGPEAKVRLAKIPQAKRTILPFLMMRSNMLTSILVY